MDFITGGSRYPARDERVLVTQDLAFVRAQILRRRLLVPLADGRLRTAEAVPVCLPDSWCTTSPVSRDSSPMNGVVATDYQGYTRRCLLKFKVIRPLRGDH